MPAFLILSVPTFKGRWAGPVLTPDPNVLGFTLIFSLALSVFFHAIGWPQLWKLDHAPARDGAVAVP
jgi:hypothetical protein